MLTEGPQVDASLLDCPVITRDAAPEPPRYNFASDTDFQVALAAGGATSQSDFYRSATWCPDGSAALGITESRRSVTLVFPKCNLKQRALNAATQPSAIWSSAWYPFASLTNPATFCYVLGIADGPVRLVDGNDGTVRASYSIIDHSERFVAPSSLCFNRDASRLYCGFDSAIEVFDFNRPGSDGVRLKTTPNRKSREGQKGLISALSFAPDGSGTFAAGSYSGTIGIYSEDSGADRLAEVSLGEASSGVTQLAYHPLDPHILFAAFRMADHIAGYDMRNLNAGPFVRLHRPGRTQQRLSFDIDWAGRYLATGGTDGFLRIYDIGSPSCEMLWQSHSCDDTIGSVSMHPFEPTLLSALGSRNSVIRDYQVSDISTTYTHSDSEDDSAALDDDTSSTRSFVDGQDSHAPRLGLMDLSEGRPVEASGIVPS